MGRKAVAESQKAGSEKLQPTFPGADWRHYIRNSMSPAKDFFLWKMMFQFRLLYIVFLNLPLTCLLTWSFLLFDTPNRGMKRYCLVLIGAMHPNFPMKQDWVYHLSSPSAFIFFVILEWHTRYKSIQGLEIRTFLQERKIGLVQWGKVLKASVLVGVKVLKAYWKSLWRNWEIRDQSLLSKDKVGNCANCRAGALNPLPITSSGLVHRHSRNKKQGRMKHTPH